MEIEIDISEYSDAIRTIIDRGDTPGAIIEFLLPMKLEDYEPSQDRDYDLANTRTRARVEVKTDSLKQRTFTSTLHPDRFDEVILVDLSRIAEKGCIYARLVSKVHLCGFLTNGRNGGKRLTLAKYDEMVEKHGWNEGNYRTRHSNPQASA